MWTAPGPLPPIVLTAPALPPVIVREMVPADSASIILTDSDILDLRADGVLEFEGADGHVIILEYFASDKEVY